MKEVTDMMVLYAVSPVHAGSGQALSAVDLPIQRERHTQWPIVQASGMKGAFREHFRKTSDDKDKRLINFIFGTDYGNDKDETMVVLDKDNKKIDAAPGCIAVSDAKIFAFPMRSDVAPFVHVTCPSVLKRLKNDLSFIGESVDFEIPNVGELDAWCLRGEISGEVILEDVEVKIGSKKEIKVPSELTENIAQLLLVSDEIFQYCVTSCTDIQTQIKIDSETGTAQNGALRYEELLPADTVMYSVVYYQSSVFKSDLQAKSIRDKVQASVQNYVQIGGDWTLGRGICHIKWIDGGKNE